MAAATKTVMKAEDDNERAFLFPQGMAGFSDAKEYGFIYQGHGDIVCIQCIDHPEAAFLLTPWDEERLGPPPKLAPDLCECIQISDQSQIMWMIVLNPFANKQWVTANLKAPIALNVEGRMGMQCIRPEVGLADLRFNWMPQPES